MTDWFGSELKNSNVNVRKAYVMKLDDEEVLKNVALNEYNGDIGVEAVERINTNSIWKKYPNPINFVFQERHKED